MAEKEPSSDMEDDTGQDMSSSKTPDLWMLRWLQLYRKRLLDGMQNAVPIILDYLVDKGKIDPLRDVFQEIMLDTTTDVQKARKLLDWLATQPPAVFWSFQHAIRQDRLRTEAVHGLAVSDKEMRELRERVNDMSLPEKLNLMSCRSVLKAREELQKFYRSRDKLLMSAGLAKGKTMSMDKILVNVCLLSEEEVKKAFEKPSFSSRQDQERSEFLLSKLVQNRSQSLDLEDVFKAKDYGQDDPNKVVATGGAGCGKSVCFTRKAPYEWACGKLWKQFALLFCLELRDKNVWKAKTLADLLGLAELHLSTWEQDEIVQFITNHPDGLDEGSINESSLLWRLLQGKCVGIPSGLRVIVTTRPCKAAGDISQSISYRGVEIVGFTEEDVALFARKYLGQNAGDKLLSLLEKQPEIGGMLHAPLFCLLVCDLFQEEQDLPSRRTELFEKIIVALLHRYAKAHSLEEPFQDWADAPASLREMVIGLGKVAFEGLKEKQLYFTDVELKKAGMPAAALELGLLTKSESTKFWKRDEYAFSHLTLQEFMAALYVSSEVLQTDADMAKLLETVRFKDGHLTTFWVFLAGVLRGGILEAFLRAMSDQPELINITSYMYAVQRLQLYRCFYESELGKRGAQSASVGTLLKKISSINLFGQMTRSVSDCAAISTVLRAHQETEKFRRVSFIACRIPDAGFEQLLCGLQPCKSIQKFTMRHVFPSLPTQHMSSMGTILANSASTLEEVGIENCVLGDDGLQQLAPGLQQCRNLKMLRLSNTGLTLRSAPTLRNVVSCLPRLEELFLSENDLHDSGMEQLASGLQHWTALQLLGVQFTKLSSRSVPVLCNLLSSLHQLNRVWVDGNGFTRNDLIKLQQSVQRDVHLF